MTDLTEFQQRACAAAVIKMLGGKTFFVSDLSDIAKTMGRQQALSGKDYAALSSLHCIEWGDMGPELARQVREKCLELLGMPPQVLEMAQRTDNPKAEPPSEPARRLRLAFWK